MKARDPRSAARDTTCLQPLRPDDLKLIDSAKTMFNDSALTAVIDSARNAPGDSLLQQRADSAKICQDAFQQIYTQLSSNRLFRGLPDPVSSNDHDGWTNGKFGRPEISITHIDEDILDSLQTVSKTNPSAAYRSLLELLVHEGIHGLAAFPAHPDEPYPYTTPPYNLPTSGNPPCVRR
jgi:hypothetical protein